MDRQALIEAYAVHHGWALTAHNDRGTTADIIEMRAPGAIGAAGDRCVLKTLRPAPGARAKLRAEHAVLTYLATSPVAPYVPAVGYAYLQRQIARL